ncbi:hypothetical protein [Ruegeria atlantica]|uniref:hypothetical protein n=1 Tax=Ruegeria atlantica TaxID=81569 RepID=UPI0024950D18|nr:hypothetical protein [Ruegeria atlantica]
MAQVNRLPQDERLQYHDQIVAPKDQLEQDPELRRAYDSYLREISSTDYRFTPADHYRLLHAGCSQPKDFVAIAQSQERLIPEWALANPDALEQWKSEDKIWRRAVHPYDPDREWSGDAGALQTWCQKSKQIKDLNDPRVGTEAHGMLGNLAGRKDVYISQNAFGNEWRIASRVNERRRQKEQGVASDNLIQIDAYRREADNVNSYRSFFQDFDKLDEYHQMTPEQFAAYLMAYCEVNDFPLPTYITFTGRGIATSWVFDWVNRNARDRWDLVMKQLLAYFESARPDANVVDGSRVLRPWGTENSKSGEIVRPLWINGTSLDDIHIYNFDELCDRILPRKRVEYLAASKAKRDAKLAEHDEENARKLAHADRESAQKKRDRPRAKHLKGRRSYNHVLVDDLEKLHMGRHAGGRLSANRDINLLIWVSAQSNIVARDETRGLPAHKVLEEKAIAKGVQFGLTAGQAREYMSTAIERCRQQRILDRAVYDGVPLHVATGGLSRYSPRHKTITYSYSAERVITELGISDQEMRAFNLRVLVTLAISKERDRQRKAEERGQIAVPMSLQERASERLKQAKEVLEARLSGLSIRKLAEQFRRSTRTIQKWIKLAMSYRDNLESKVEVAASESVVLCPGRYNEGEAKRRESNIDYSKQVDSIPPEPVEPVIHEPKQRGDERAEPEVRALRDVSPAPAGTSRPTWHDKNKKPSENIIRLADRKQKHTLKPPMVPKVGPTHSTYGQVLSYKRAMQGEEQIYRDPTDPEQAITASGAVISLSEYRKGRGDVSDLPDPPQELLDDLKIHELPDGTWMQIPF